MRQIEQPGKLHKRLPLDQHHIPGVDASDRHGGGRWGLARWGHVLSREDFLHALLDARRNPVLAPALRRLPTGEILTLAGGPDEAVRFQRIATGAHEDTAIVLGRDIVLQHQLDGGLDAAIDGLGEPGRACPATSATVSRKVWRSVEVSIT